MARIAIAGFMHETNCFVPDVTDPVARIGWGAACQQGRDARLVG